MKPTFVRRATLADVNTVAERIRPEDHAEALAASGLPPLAIFLAYLKEGREVIAAGLQEDNRAEVLFGVDPVPMYPETGVPWMMSTAVIYEHPTTFVPNSRKWWEWMHGQYEILTNLIDARNTRHINWLRWLGCVFPRRVEKYGAQSLPFIEFVSIRKPCA